jgi:hypothetical protein
MPSSWSQDERRQLALVLERNIAPVLSALQPVAPDDAERRPPLAVLLAVRSAADAIEDATRFAVSQAREAGHTWQEIGELLAVTRQAAQQRFGDRPAGRDAPEHGALALRAAELVGQVDRGDWEAATADWSGVMHDALSVERLRTVWSQIIETAGPLQGVGRPSVSRKGPYRVADVPLVFEHGPMRARVTFDHDDHVSGLFVVLPDDE